MKPFILIAFTALFGGFVQSHKDYVLPLDYNAHASRLSNPRHPTVKEGEGWKSARQYIKEQFVRESLTLKVQTFETTVSNAQDEESLVEGENIIGIAEGHSGSSDRVIVVGADYATSQLPTSSLANNGAGVAALIEIIRLYNGLIRSNDFYSNYTVIFVAFDLNTKEDYPSKGRQGSQVFVNDWLLSYLKDDLERFRGAIILDQITNVNYDKNSQTLFINSPKYFPEAYARISEDDHKGNFIAMLTHWESFDDSFADDFAMTYNKKRKLEPFRLQEMKITRGIGMNDPTFRDLLGKIETKSQYPFWEAKLPAFLLTDTASYRIDKCERQCRPIDLVSGERKKFMDATTYAVIDTLLRLQTTHLRIDQPTENSSSTLALSFLPASLVIAIAMLLH